MPLNRSNPFHLDVTGPVSLGANDQAERVALTKIVQDALRSDHERAGWLNRQQTLSKLRYGLRPRIKDFPFKGASNLAIPLIDSTIRKHKPLLMRLIVEPDPVVEFQGDDPQAVTAERDAEEVYNWLFKTHMDSIEPMAYVIDTQDHRGFAFAQVAWDYRTEYECRSLSVAKLFPQALPMQSTAPEGEPPPVDREAIMQTLADAYELDRADPRTARSLERTADRIEAGQQHVKVAFRKVVRDKPCVIDRDPVQVLMPSRTTHIGDAEWIVIQHVLSRRQLEQMEADGHFMRGAVAKIKADMAKSDAAQSTRGGDADMHFTQSLHSEREIQDRREQIWGREDDGNILVWQIYHWHDIDGDDLLDRVETWIHPRSLTKLVSRPYLMPFHRWPLVKFDFEKTSRRWHAPRGISAMLEGLQREINAQHNARIDAMTLKNAPIYQVPALAGFKARNFRAIPGTILQMPQGGRIEPLVQDRSAFPEQVSEEQQLRAISENYIGTFDAALSNPLAVQKARTATEIQAATQFASSVANFDTILFQLSMRDLHEMIWKLWLDLGPDEIYIKVLGDAGAPASKLIKKADIDRSFKLIPTGTIANTNRALELAHAREALQLYVNDQSGFIDPFELRRWHINLLAFRQARRILTDRNQAQELQVLRQAAAEVQQNPELQSALSGGGVFNVPPQEIERQQTEQLPRQTANRF